jgi:hypothetical protein
MVHVSPSIVRHDPTDPAENLEATPDLASP